jgi:small secreted domain DUF320
MEKARWVSAAVGTAVLVAGFAITPSAAFADGGGDGNGGVLSVLSGNGVNAPVSLPVNICGVAAGLLGGANASCDGGAASNTTVNGGNGGNGNGNAGVISAGSGNTVNLPVSAPVNLCGVAGSVGGFSNADCKGGSASNTTINGGGGNGGNGNGNAGSISALSGNTVNAPVSVPVNVCGIAVALIGFSNASCVGGAFSNTTINGGGGGNGNGNAGSIAALAGNTVNVPVSIPVNACGIAAGVAGFANADCKGGAASNTTIGGSGGNGNGNAGGLALLSGNNVNAPVSIPVNVCGIAVGLLGFSNASCQGGSFSNTTTGTTPTPTPTPCLTTPPPTCQCTTPTPTPTPPGHHHHHHGHTPPPGGGTPPGTPPGGGTPPNTAPHTGTAPGSGSTTGSVPGSLPITGADLLGMGIAALASLGIGGALLMARRRRHSEVS